MWSIEKKVLPERDNLHFPLGPVNTRNFVFRLTPVDGERSMENETFPIFMVHALGVVEFGSMVAPVCRYILERVGTLAGRNRVKGGGIDVTI